MSPTTMRPRRLSRSQTIEPGVVAPTMPTFTPPRSTTVQPRKARLPSGRLALAARSGNSRLACRALEERYAVVELVVAHRGRVVAHGVHRGHDRVRGVGGRHARRDEAERVALNDVAGVYENDATVGRVPQRVHDGRGAGEPDRRIRGVEVVVPAADAAVDVGGRRDDELHRGRRGRRRGGAADRGARAPAQPRRARAQ